MIESIDHLIIISLDNYIKNPSIFRLIHQQSIKLLQKTIRFYMVFAQYSKKNKKRKGDETWTHQPCDWALYYDHRIQVVPYSITDANGKVWQGIRIIKKQHLPKTIKNQKFLGGQGTNPDVKFRGERNAGIRRHCYEA